MYCVHRNNYAARCQAETERARRQERERLGGHEGGHEGTRGGHEGRPLNGGHEGRPLNYHFLPSGSLNPFSFTSCSPRAVATLTAG